jgi:hypothetical protein
MPIDVPIPQSQIDIEIDAPSTDIIYNQNQIHFHGDDRLRLLDAQLNGTGIFSGSPIRGIEQITISFWFRAEPLNPGGAMFGTFVSLQPATIGFDIFALKAVNFEFSANSPQGSSPFIQTSPISLTNTADIEASNFGLSSPTGQLIRAVGPQGLDFDVSPENLKHFMLSWQSTQAGGDNVWTLYIDDFLYINSPGDKDIPFGANIPVHSAIGGDASNSGAGKVRGDFGDVWISTEQYVDFRVEANRQLFESPTIEPIYLGTRGELPTGQIPEHFFGSDHKAVDWNAGTNLGTIGNESPVIAGWTMDGTVEDV